MFKLYMLRAMWNIGHCEPYIKKNNKYKYYIIFYCLHILFILF